MCIRRHHAFSGSLRQFDKCSRPFADVGDEHARTRTNVQTQVGRNLLVAAAASMKFEPEVADCFDQFHLDEVVNVLRVRSIVHPLLRIFGQAAQCNLIESVSERRLLGTGQYVRCFQRKGMRLAGSYFFLNQLPVKAEGTLPVIESRVEWLAKAAGPHLGGLFAHQFSSPFVMLSFFVPPFFAPLFSCGISEPWLSVMRPVCAYVISLARVSVMSRLRMVSWPMRSRGEKADSVFSMLRRSGAKVRLGDSVFRIE